MLSEVSAQKAWFDGTREQHVVNTALLVFLKEMPTHRSH